MKVKELFEGFEDNTAEKISKLQKRISVWKKLIKNKKNDDGKVYSTEQLEMLKQDVEEMEEEIERLKHLYK